MRCTLLVSLLMILIHTISSAEEITTGNLLPNIGNNAVNIEFLKDRTKKLTEDVEKLIRNGNGAH